MSADLTFASARMRLEAHAMTRSHRNRARRCRFPPGRSLLLCLALALVASEKLVAQERFYRLFDSEEGLNPVAVRALAQDSTGFLWIGTEGGLFRYDGVELRRWSPERIDRTIVAITVSSRGSLIVLQEGGALFRITIDGADPVRGPQGAAITDARDAAFDSQGTLWIIRDHEVWRRNHESRWSAIVLPLRERERPTQIRTGGRGSILLATTEGAWRITATRAKRLLEFRDIVDLLEVGDDRVLVLGFLGELFEVSSAGSREIPHAGAGLGRAISIAVRGSTVWIALDRYLVAWHSDRNTELLGVESGIQSGGPLLVDHEGSLWMGSFTGLYQFPEPETTIWTERSGLPSNHTRYLARTADTVWITTWQGVGTVRDEGGKKIASSEVLWSSQSRLWVDSRGILWAGSDGGILEIDGQGGVRRHRSGWIGLAGFHETADGEIWLGTSVGLLRRDPVEETLRPVLLPASLGAAPPVEAVLMDRHGELWVSSGEAVCRAPVRRIRENRITDWSCDRIPGAVLLSGLVEMPSGAIWASTSRLGVLRVERGAWVSIPGMRDLPSRAILSLVPARTLGVWIVGHGVLHRMTEATDEEQGWRIEERLSFWHGLPSGSGTHILEDADGGIWTTTSRGVAHVPAPARFTPTTPPRVVVVDARVDDQRIRLGEELELPHERNRLELRFAALSYRDPSYVSYQVRLSESDPWVMTSEAAFRWVSLPAGRYRAEVRASLDGETWSPGPAAFSFRVAPPWYSRPWAIALYAATVALLLYAVHRFRVAHLLRLERQRTRIAMDLHDEIGSGLGSIGILSGMLSSDGIADRDREEMARQIAGTAQELGSGLSHIVWALDPKSRTLEEIGARLAEHGRRLFADVGTELTTRFPTTWPPVRPSPLVRRNVLLIGLEALHNVARHAGARKVELGLMETQNGIWELTVTDDGRGFSADPESTGGLGLRSMQRRAKEMGSELHWSTPPYGGTKVKLVFGLRRPSRPWSRVRSRLSRT
jgi:signal transduction histidine kinase/ligand-binding sensor domain-containing protein